MLILYLFAFLSGLVTILTPCIWPLLPFILSASAGSHGHQRPMGITLGIVLSFAVLTLFISTLVKIIPFNPNSLRLLAVIVISFLGISLIIPQFSQILESFISRISGFLGSSKVKNETGFGQGFVTGLTLGVV